MRATELRIGNWFKYENGKEHQIDLNFWFYASQDESYFTDTQPIPLTEEWLVKFGWVKENGWYQNPELNYIHGAKFKKDGSLLSLHLPFFHINTSQCGKRFPLLYVHQLQNLYFALTGEEL